MASIQSYEGKRRAKSANTNQDSQLLLLVYTKADQIYQSPAAQAL
jgi:hypothetical protein